MVAEIKRKFSINFFLINAFGLASGFLRALNFKHSTFQFINCILNKITRKDLYFFLVFSIKNIR